MCVCVNARACVCIACVCIVCVCVLCVCVLCVCVRACVCIACVRVCVCVCGVNSALFVAEDMLKVKVKLLLPESMLAAVKSLLTKVRESEREIASTHARERGREREREREREDVRCHQISAQKVKVPGYLPQAAIL